MLSAIQELNKGYDHGFRTSITGPYNNEINVRKFFSFFSIFFWKNAVFKS